MPTPRTKFQFMNQDIDIPTVEDQIKVHHDIRSISQLTGRESRSYNQCQTFGDEIDASDLDGSNSTPHYLKNKS